MTSDQRNVPGLAEAAVRFVPDDAWQDGDLVDALLDHVPWGVVLATARLAVLHASGPARRIIDTRTEVRMIDGRLGLASPARDAELLHLAARIETGEAGRGALMRIAGEGARRPIIISVLSSARTSRGKARSVIINLVELDPDTMGLETRLVAAFGLTQAEARLAGQLAGGSTLAETGAAMGVATSTLRVQLRNSFQKTGTKRQSELVALLTRLQLVPMPSADQ